MHAHECLDCGYTRDCTCNERPSRYILLCEQCVRAREAEDAEADWLRYSNDTYYMEDGHL